MVEKVIVQDYKKSIRDSRYTVDQVSIIWDFYVTHSVAESAGQKRKPKDYGLSSFPIKDMKSIAGWDKKHCVVLLANSMKKTLEKLDFVFTEKINKTTIKKSVDICTPRIACLTPFTVADDEPAKAKCGEAESILTHIRNSFAHGNTYFFDNNMVLLEDKSKGIITAEILLSMKILLDWIKLIDKNEKFYAIHELKFNEKTGE